MEALQEKPSLKQEENHESFTKEINFTSLTNNLLWKDLQNKTNEANTENCIMKPDNQTTSILDVKNNKKEDILEGKEIAVNNLDNLVESVDLSDLTFSCNDYILGDCTCFEQASQLVDPTIKDSESTPFSFNNSDSVQLFRFSLTEDNIDNLFSSYDKYDKNDKGTDHNNFYRLFELLDNNNMNVSPESIDERPKGKKGRGSLIKKGRRYLPNFKQKVLEYTKNHTFKQTALHFNINCNTITEWSRESKRLSLQHNKPAIPGSDHKNYKTDIVGTPESKTEILLLNDVINFETEPFCIEKELPSGDLRPDERFIKWVEGRRSQRRESSRQEVYHAAKCCLKHCTSSQDKSSWFVLWFKRFSEALNSSGKPIMVTEKYIKYPNSFKLEVALYARIFTKNSAARVFNVPRRRMFDWFNCLNPLKDSFALHETGVKSEKVTMQSVLAVKKDKIKNKIYSELHVWYQRRFSSGVKPTSYEIKEKGKEIFSLHGITGIKFSDGWLQKFCQKMNIKLRNSEDDRLLLWVLTQLDNNVTLSHQQITEKSSSLIGSRSFKGSKGWTLRFLKRHRNLLQSCPSAQDQLPQIVQGKLNHFWDTFRQSLISLQIEPGNVGCMDEIPLSFSYPEESKSTSPPLLRKTGFDNCQGVVILSAQSNGRVLPPAVVFKGNGPKQLLSTQNVNILILYEEKGLITIDVLKAWVNDIWLRCTPTPNVLVVDSFQPHCEMQLRQLLAKENCLLHIIPEGCSSKFQPLDLEVTPLFKKAIKNQWKDLSVNSNLNTSKTIKRYRCPDQDTILRWVQSAYDKIKGNPVSIINSFKTTGLLQ